MGPSVRTSAALALLLVVAAFDSGCSGGSDDAPSMPWPFESGRNADEAAILALTTPMMHAYIDGQTTGIGDPARLNRLVDNVLSRGGYPTPDQQSRAAEVLQEVGAVRAYVTAWARGPRRLEAIMALLLASQLVAVLEHLDLTPPTAAAASREPAAEAVALFREAWDDVVNGLLHGDLERLVLPDAIDGADCGEAPPADGSLPPTESASVGLDFLWDDVLALKAVGGLRLRTYLADLVRMPDNADRVRPHLATVKAHLDAAELCARRREGDLSHLFDNDALAAALTARLEAVLHRIAKAPTSGPPVDPAFVASVDAYRAALDDLAGAVLPQLRVGLPNVGELTFHHGGPDGFEIGFRENTTYFAGEPAPYFLDGNVWPVLHAIPFAGGGGWTQIPYEGPLVGFPVHFEPFEVSRPLAHIDFRLRRHGDPEVLREVRHLPHADGTIAFGHDFNMLDLRPDQAGYETFVVEAVPVTTANHPAHGTCTQIHVEWVREPSAEPDPLSPDELGLNIDGTTYSFPPLDLDDPECRRGGGRLD